MKSKILTVDKYIQQFPASTQKMLKVLRKIITKEAKGAVEGIAYGMPGYKVNGRPLVYFAAYKSHIGLYPTPSGVKQFQSAFKKAKYKWSKGAVQFPLNRALPIVLIKKILKYRLKQVR